MATRLGLTLEKYKAVRSSFFRKQNVNSKANLMNVSLKALIGRSPCWRKQKWRIKQCSGNTRSKNRWKTTSKRTTSEFLALVTKMLLNQDNACPLRLLLSTTNFALSSPSNCNNSALNRLTNFKNPTGSTSSNFSYLAIITTLYESSTHRFRLP